MTVSPVLTETAYALVGATLGPFNTVWPYNAPGDVTVQLDRADGAGPVTLAQGSDYLLTNNNPTLSNGGSVTLAAYVLTTPAWNAGAQVALVRLTPRSQPSTFGEATGFSPQASEQALDNVERQVQELTAAIGRAISVEVGAPNPGPLPGGDSMLWGTDANGHSMAFNYGDEMSRLLGVDSEGNLTWYNLVNGAVISMSNFYDTVAMVQASILTAAPRPNYLWVAGYYTVGDGGDGIYMQAAPGAGPGKIQDGGGNWWQLVATGQMTPRKFGARGDGVANDLAAVQACLNFCAANGVIAWLTRGPYACAGDVTVPVMVTPSASPSIFAIRGAGWGVPGLIFTAGSNGLYSTGPANNYYYPCSISDLYIRCSGGAVGITDTWLTKPSRSRILIVGASAQGVNCVNCNVPTWTDCQVMGCGNASAAQVEFDRCTTLTWRDGYIAGGAAGCVAGLRIDRTLPGVVQGGAIESCGVLIQIGSKAENAISSWNLSFDSIDLENPTGPYIQIGKGWTGASGTTWAVRDIRFSNLSGSPSGSTSMPYIMDVSFAAGLVVQSCHWGYLAGTTAFYNFAGTGNLDVEIGRERNNYGAPLPWVMWNGLAVNWATPYSRWTSQTIYNGAVDPMYQSINPTTATLANQINATQGGLYSNMALTNSGPITIQKTAAIPNITGLNGNGFLMYLVAQDANQTIQHAAGGVGQFINKTGANITMTAGQVLAYFYNAGTGNWVQL